MTIAAHAHLKPQTQQVLRAMIERGSITKREASEFECWNLPGRILEIREAFGAGAVETEKRPNRKRGWHARYVWTGRIVPQTELDL